MNDGLLSQGESVDRYVVEGVLGEGGMAVVYRLRHKTLGSTHALKVLKVDRADIRARLVTEGQLQASLRHPNIVAVNDVLDVKGRTGLLMELVEGPSLYEWLYHNNPPLSQGLEIFRGILAGVSRAHRAGLVHRDLKAANVLLDSSDGKVIPKVTDFGLAKVLDEGGNHTQTRTGMALGTPRYMAPEQIRNSKEVDARADVFALGCLLYRFACGRDPFENDDTFALFESICHGRYPAPEVLNPGIPASVRAAIVGSLAVDRELRIPDCDTLLAVLDGETKHKGRAPSTMAPMPQTTRTSVPAPPPTAVSAAPWLALGAVGVAGIAALMVLVLAGGWWWLGRGDEGATSATPTLAVGPEPAADPTPAVSTPPEVATPAPGVESEPAPARPAPVAAGSTGPKASSPAAEPAAAPESEPPARAVATGTVRVTGDATVTLSGANGRFGPGSLPVGSYEVTATFPGREPRSFGRVSISAGQTVRIACDASFANCSVGD